MRPTRYAFVGRGLPVPRQQRHVDELAQGIADLDDARRGVHLCLSLRNVRSRRGICKPKLGSFGAAPLAYCFYMCAIGSKRFGLAGLKHVDAKRRANANARKIHLVLGAVLRSNLLLHTLPDKPHMRAGSFDFFAQRIG